MFQLIQSSPPVPNQETSQDGDPDIQKSLLQLLDQLTMLSHLPSQQCQVHLEAPMVTPNPSSRINRLDSLKLPQPVMFQLTQSSPPVPLQETSQDGDLDIQKLLLQLPNQSTMLSHPPSQPCQVHSVAPTEILNLSLLKEKNQEFNQEILLPLSHLKLPDGLLLTQTPTPHNPSSKSQEFSQVISLPLSHLKSPDGLLQTQTPTQHNPSSKSQVFSQVISPLLSHLKSPDGLLLTPTTHNPSSKSQEFNQVISLPLFHHKLPDGLLLTPTTQATGILFLKNQEESPQTTQNSQKNQPLEHQSQTVEQDSVNHIEDTTLFNKEPTLKELVESPSDSEIY
jgi:hypothetical protein